GTTSPVFSTRNGSPGAVDCPAVRHGCSAPGPPRDAFVQAVKTIHGVPEPPGLAPDAAVCEDRRSPEKPRRGTHENLARRLPAAGSAERRAVRSMPPWPRTMDRNPATRSSPVSVGMLAALTALSLAACAGAPPPPPADLVITGGRVYTVEPDRPWAEAVAVRGDRIIRVGTEPEVRALSGPNTREYNVAGGLVLPGFNDS